MAHARSVALRVAILVTASSLAPVAAGAQDPAPVRSVAANDGKQWIVYEWGIGPGIGMRLVRTDGTDDRGVLEGVTPGEQKHPDWSPDGTSIVLFVRVPGRTGIGRLCLLRQDDPPADRVTRIA